MSNEFEDWIVKVNGSNFPPYNLRDKLNLEYNDFDTLFEQNVALGYEKEYVFDDTIGWLPYEVDMEKGVITMGQFEFEFQVIGTYSLISSTWLWGWANEKSSISKNLLEQANVLKQLGEDRNVDFLTNRKLEVAEDFPFKIGLICTSVFNCSTFQVCSYGDGKLLITITDKRIPPVDNNNLPKIIECFNSMISRYSVNHKEAFKHYLLDRETEFEEEDEKTIRATKGGARLTASFDDENRLIKLDLEN